MAKTATPRQTPPRKRASAKTLKATTLTAPLEFGGDIDLTLQPSQEPGAAAASRGEAIERIGKDEMNLIEFPFALLWTRKKDTKILREWEYKAKGGEIVKCSWQVTSDSEVGLPNGQSIRVMMVFIEMTREADMAQTVHFTLYELLKRLGWPDTVQYYNALRDALRRLRGVRIVATNCWRKPNSKGYDRETGLQILANMEIFSQSQSEKARARSQGDELPLCWFKWDDIFFASIAGGHLTTFDMDFALSIKSDSALSLFRILNKKTYRNPFFQMDLEEFYNRHLALTPTPYISKMKERLKTGHDELIESGWLESVWYEPSKRTGREKVCYLKRVAQAESGAPDTQDDTPAEGEFGTETLRQRMLEIGVNEEFITAALRDYARDEVKLQLDCLAERRATNPAALFRFALVNLLAPPPSYRRRVQSQDAAVNAAQRLTQERQEKEMQDRAARKAAAEAKKFYADMSERVKHIIDIRIVTELGDVFTGQRARKGSGGWNGALVEVLSDLDFREQMQELHDASPFAMPETAAQPPAGEEEDDDDLDQYNAPTIAAFHPELYVETITDSIEAQPHLAWSQVDANLVDGFRSTTFLDDTQWATVKVCVLGIAEERAAKAAAAEDIDAS